MNVIEIENLTREYGGGKGIFGLGFAVQEGEAFGFLGPNGAGKTTTIRHLMGFLRPRQGRCAIAGLDCWKQRASVQQSLGYIPGEMALPGEMSGESFLRFYARYRGMKGAGRKKSLLERFELDARGGIRRMSKGMKQKLGIVAAFMHDPAVLILDEATSGLDPLMQNRFIELVLEEKKRGKTILMSSHMFDEVERSCHRVGIIRAGRMAAVESVETLKAAQVQRYAVTLRSEADARGFAADGLAVESIEGARVTVRVQNDLPALVAAMGRWPVTKLAAPGQGLEEIFLQYFGGEKA